MHVEGQPGLVVTRYSAANGLSELNMVELLRRRVANSHENGPGAVLGFFLNRAVDGHSLQI